MDAMSESFLHREGKKRFHIGGQQAKLSLFRPLPREKKGSRERNVIREPCRRVRREQALTNPRKKAPRAKEKTLWASRAASLPREEKIAPARFEISLVSLSGALYDSQLVIKATCLLAHPGTELRGRGAVMT